MNNKWIKNEFTRMVIAAILFTIGFPVSFLPVTVEYASKFGTESMWAGMIVFIMLTVSWLLALMELTSGS